MGQFLDEIPTHLMEWLPKQQMFWVASAPLSADGHINVSPKGIEGTFRVVNSRRVWYEDLSGTGRSFNLSRGASYLYIFTGAETVSHIRENGRVTILFHAFDGPARIVRLYGKGIHALWHIFFFPMQYIDSVTKQDLFTSLARQNMRISWLQTNVYRAQELSLAWMLPKLGPYVCTAPYTTYPINEITIDVRLFRSILSICWTSDPTYGLGSDERSR